MNTICMYVWILFACIYEYYLYVCQNDICMYVRILFKCIYKYYLNVFINTI